VGSITQPSGGERIPAAPWRRSGGSERVHSRSNSRSARPGTGRRTGPQPEPHDRLGAAVRLLAFQQEYLGRSRATRPAPGTTLSLATVALDGRADGRRGLGRTTGTDVPRLAASGAALVCWGLALGGCWPVACALYGQRALPAAGALLTQRVGLAATAGALLAIALPAALRAAARGAP
jgi:hypothetical protein